VRSLSLTAAAFFGAAVFDALAAEVDEVVLVVVVFDEDEVVSEELLPVGRDVVTDPVLVAVAVVTPIPCGMLVLGPRPNVTGTVVPSMMRPFGPMEMTWPPGRVMDVGDEGLKVCPLMTMEPLGVIVYDMPLKDPEVGT
jgi:hypothetical protein